MQHELDPIIERARKVRLTEHELRALAGIDPGNYWRAKKNKVGPAAQIKMLRALERVLDEKEKAQ